MRQNTKIQHGGSRKNSGRQSRSLEGDMIVDTTWRYTKASLTSLKSVMESLKEGGHHVPNKSLVVNYAVNSLSASQLSRLASIYDKAITKYPESEDNEIKATKVYYTEETYSRVSQINSKKGIKMGVIVSAALIHLEVEIETSLSKETADVSQYAQIEAYYEKLLQNRNAQPS